MKLKAIHFAALFVFLFCCNSAPKENNTNTESETDTSVPALSDASAKLPLNLIQLPAGFSISVYAEVEDARSMALSPSGILYVGNRSEDKVYALKDTDGDYKADKKWVLASGLNMPNGVAFKDGDLYVAEVNRIHRFPKIESNLNKPTSQIVYDKFPTEKHHGWKYIAFGPDGKLYVPVGAPCNICESADPIFASITRMNADGTGLEVFAHGVRNTVGFTWHPETKNIWFTDNGRDMMGDDVPPCELNTATKMGQHFGYPYCHGGTIKDPEFGNKKPCSEFVRPAQNLGAHVAPLGLKFYTGNMFPAEYKNQIILAEHGSWNRTKKNGYQLSLVKVDVSGKATSYTAFATGWKDDAKQTNWGRPVDVLVMPDGSMLVSDDGAGVIYRITYKS
ncbi:MAG: sorbosone dehydrogenase family protein [Bacteroidetes bacterium]|nr:sorbosone dehydrogenase family protein [Bacteroidota bacterium]